MHTLQRKCLLNIAERYYGADRTSRMLHPKYYLFMFSLFPINCHDCIKIGRVLVNVRLIYIRPHRLIMNNEK